MSRTQSNLVFLSKISERKKMVLKKNIFSVILFKLSTKMLNATVRKVMKNSLLSLVLYESEKQPLMNCISSWGQKKKTVNDKQCKKLCTKVYSNLCNLST